MTSPGDTEAQKLAADALTFLRSGNTEKALNTSEQGLRTHPNHPALLQCKGLAAMQMGDAATAVEALTACLAQEANQPGLWEILGGAQEVLAKFDDALTSYDQAIKHSPSRSSGHQCKGALLVRLQQFEEGIKTLDQAITLNDKDAQA